MVPTLGFLFDKKALADVKVPVRLYRAGKDRVPGRALQRREHPQQPADTAGVRGGRRHGALHLLFTLQPGAEPWVKWICEDAPGINRVAYHKKLNAEMVDFFRRTLDVP